MSRLRVSLCNGSSSECLMGRRCANGLSVVGVAVLREVDDIPEGFGYNVGQKDSKKVAGRTQESRGGRST